MPLPLVQHGILSTVYTSITPTGIGLTVNPPEPGTILIDDRAYAQYRFVKNAHSAALAKGDAVTWSYGTASPTDVKQPATADLDALAGIAMGAPAASGFGWIQIYGFNDTVHVDGSVTAIVAKDSLKGVNAALALGKDAAAGTNPAFHNHCRALEAATANTTKKGMVSCLAV